jgi:hypothetical protein
MKVVYKEYQQLNLSGIAEEILSKWQQGTKSLPSNTSGTGVR